MICDICAKNKPDVKEFKHPFYVISICEDCLNEK